MESMLEGMAEYYSADLAVKITRGMKENALKCRYNGGGMPFGYMVNAIQMGIITNSTKERLDELEAEKKKLELAIAEETLEHPDVPKEYFEHWLRHFRSGDVDDPEYRKLLVDIFVNAIYVTDDGLRFALNFFDGVETIPLREWDQAKGSDLLGYAPPKILESTGSRISFLPKGCGFMKKVVSRKKLGKKARKALDSQRRVRWLFSPTTRKVESKKIYNRNRKPHTWIIITGMGLASFLDLPRDL